jgi:hypothetical protein
MTTTTTWNRRLIGQLEFYWEAHLSPRLEGLTDEEYLWEPVDGCWSLRPAGDGRWRMDHGDGPAGPFTTIAWRMAHVAVEVFESRYRAFFGGEGPHQWAPGQRILAAGELPGTAKDAVAYLAGAYARWRDAIAGLTEPELMRPLGPKGADFAEQPMAELVLHLNREAMHHGAEICLLRDLYRDAGGATLVPRDSGTRGTR